MKVAPARMRLLWTRVATCDLIPSAGPLMLVQPGPRARLGSAQLLPSGTSQACHAPP